MQCSLVPAPASPLTTKKGMDCVVHSVRKACESWKPSKAGMRRSRRIASGRCSSASASASSGSPVSTISQVSPRLTRIRRRTASSSSTTRRVFMGSIPHLSGNDGMNRLRSGQIRVRFGITGTGRVQKGAHGANEGFLLKRLVNQMSSRLENAVARDKAVRIAGHVEHSQAGLTSREALGKDAAIDAGHHHVGQEKINASGVALDRSEGFFAVLCDQNVETVGNEEGFRQFAKRIGIFDEKDSLGAGKDGARRGRGLLSGQAFVNARQIKLEGCALAEGAFDQNVASALLDDAIDGSEAESGAFAVFLGGEKWFEDVRLRFRVHADAGIGN